MISVIVPTHNRRASVLRLLDSLARQDFPLKDLEVIVVADHCRDDTMEVLRGHSAPFAFRCVPSTVRGPAAVRNLGASLATGRLLIFLDDDTEPEPGLVLAHQRAHERRPGRVVIGYYPPVVGGPRSFFNEQLCLWWNRMFLRMRAHGHRFAYNDFLSGNFSIAAETFKQVGGFDPSLFCHEDYELGFRLIQEGYPLMFEAGALAYHHEKSDLPRCLERKRQEGKADVQIGRLHPAVIRKLPLAMVRKPVQLTDRLLLLAGFQGKKIFTTSCTWCLKRLLGVFEAFNWRNKWRQFLDHLMFFYYWQGVAENLGSIQELDKLLRGATGPEPKANAHWPALNLEKGLAAAERQLDQTKSAGAYVYYGRQLVGRIEPEAGREYLKGDHLRLYLLNHLSEELLITITTQSIINRSADD